MVLENTDDNVLKAKPFGMEAPYSDWKISGEDLVDYQDRDARGLTFVFSVERLSDNDAMRKMVSVYQKPSDDNTGSYVVVSASVINPNDIRIYEISNTTYGNEPDDPKLFLQKVIEMADGSGMLRKTSEYEGYHLETADSGYSMTANKKSGVSKTQNGVKTSSTNNSYSQSFSANNSNNNITKRNYGESPNHNVKVNNTVVSNGSNPVTKTTQKPNNRSINKNGNSLRQHINNNTDSISDRFKTLSMGLPGGSNVGVDPKKTSSLITKHQNFTMENNPKSAGLLDNVRNGVMDRFFSKGPSTADQIQEKIASGGNFFDKGADERSKAVSGYTAKDNAGGNNKDLESPYKGTVNDNSKPSKKDNSTIPDEVGVKPASFKNPFSEGVKNMAGGILNALGKTQQGGTVGLHPVDDYKRGTNNASKNNEKEQKRYDRDSLRAVKVNNGSVKKGVYKSKKTNKESGKGKDLYYKNKEKK